MAVTRKNKASEIAEIIESAIVRGELRPGTVLRQDQLSEELGVSRTPVREALQQLAARGLVHLDPRRGARVPLPTAAELRERWLIRAELEALAAEIGLPKISPEQIRTLRDTASQVAHLTECISRARGRELDWLCADWNDANFTFHRLVVAAAGSALVEQAINSVVQVVDGPLLWRPTEENLAYARTADTEHHAIVAAFESKDASVSRLLREHIRAALAFVSRTLDQPGGMASGPTLLRHRASPRP